MVPVSDDRIVPVTMPKWGLSMQLGKITSWVVAEGDEVLYSKYGGTEIKVDGEELLVLRESDVLAKVQ